MVQNAIRPPTIRLDGSFRAFRRIEHNLFLLADLHGVGVLDIPTPFETLHLASLKLAKILLAHVNATQLVADRIDFDILLRFRLR